ncbi:MAG TPA: hypothetical protein VGC69_06885 [Bordetella sp.]
MAFDKSINLLDLQPGARVKDAEGVVFQVVDNPGDGMWVICKALQANGALAEEDSPLFAGNIVEVLG